MTNFTSEMTERYHSVQLAAENMIYQFLDVASVMERSLDRVFIKAEDLYVEHEEQFIDTGDKVLAGLMWAANAAYVFGVWYREQLETHTETWMEASFMDVCFFDFLEEEEGDISDDDLPKLMSGWTLREVATPIVMTAVAAYRAADKVMSRRANLLAAEVAKINSRLNAQVAQVISNIKEEVTNLFSYCRSNIPFNLG